MYAECGGTRKILPEAKSVAGFAVPLPRLLKPIQDRFAAPLSEPLTQPLGCVGSSARLLSAKFAAASAEFSTPYFAPTAWALEPASNAPEITRMATMSSNATKTNTKAMAKPRCRRLLESPSLVTRIRVALEGSGRKRIAVRGSGGDTEGHDVVGRIDADLHLFDVVGHHRRRADRQCSGDRRLREHRANHRRAARTVRDLSGLRDECAHDIKRGAVRVRNEPIDDRSEER